MSVKERSAVSKTDKAYRCMYLSSTNQPDAVYRYMIAVTKNNAIV
jgi:hypothetical protein